MLKANRTTQPFKNNYLFICIKTNGFIGGETHLLIM